jgi:hypothetical protein
VSTACSIAIFLTPQLTHAGDIVLIVWICTSAQVACPESLPELWCLH